MTEEKEKTQKTIEKYLQQAQEKKASKLLLELGKPWQVIIDEKKVQVAEENLQPNFLLACVKLLAASDIPKLKETGLLKKEYTFADFGLLSLSIHHKAKFLQIFIHLPVKKEAEEQEVVKKELGKEKQAIEKKDIKIPDELELPEGFLEKSKQFLMLASKNTLLQTSVQSYCKENELFYFPLDSVGQAFFLLERWAPKSLVLDDSWSDYSALFERIYHLDFDLRSKIYCVLVSKKIKSKDSKEAFSHSVDQVIHEKDLQDFSNLAVQGKNVWQNFWSDYHKFFSD